MFEEEVFATTASFLFFPFAQRWHERRLSGIYQGVLLISRATDMKGMLVWHDSTALLGPLCMKSR
jgi:hypothetical protein